MGTINHLPASKRGRSNRDGILLNSLSHINPTRPYPCRAHYSQKKGPIHSQGFAKIKDLWQRVLPSAGWSCLGMALYKGLLGRLGVLLTSAPPAVRYGQIRTAMGKAEIPDIRANLAAVKTRIEKAARAIGRPPQSVTLVAVTKTHPPERIRVALEAGHRVFGENRVQEAKGKWPRLREAFPDLELHLIGSLQTNKVKEAVALFDAIETVDRPKLAAVLSREMALQSRRPRCFIEVNIGAEPQKAGVAPDDVAAFAAACREDYKLPIVGLMCVPPHGIAPEPYFTRLAELARRCVLPLVSMGMSEDFEIAVRCGATHVRIGTAIFGPRNP